MPRMRTSSPQESVGNGLTMNENEWQAKVVEFARWNGWHVFHPYYSRRSEPGWPDLSMIRDGHLVFAELKTRTGRVTAAQHRVLSLLDECADVEVYLWRPMDWPDVVRVLGRRVASRAV